MLPLVSVALLAFGQGCTPQEPPNWPQGGAALAIVAARWDGGEDSVEVHADGKVYEDGSLLFILDRVGRIVDADYDPVAILLPDGLVVGTDQRAMGRVGVTNASPPWSGTAWMSVLPDGNVLLFAPDGERGTLGRWQGCNGAAVRTCTLVTHLILLRHAKRDQDRSGVQVGIGVGIGI